MNMRWPAAPRVLQRVSLKSSTISQANAHSFASASYFNLSTEVVRAIPGARFPLGRPLACCSVRAAVPFSRSLFPTTIPNLIADDGADARRLGDSRGG